jgi:hypothetical protein
VLDNARFNDDCSEKAKNVGDFIMIEETLLVELAPAVLFLPGN